ncbi:MAG: glycosyltransferase [Bacteroidia bacterium]|nr:glycosyltransferase [Bacteroidia bacterium]
MKISVVIVNYNVKHFLEQALLSVFRSGKNLDMEVWVVDNNSVDNSVEMVQNQFPQVKLIANKENVGFSRANNMAIKQSNSEYILLLNPDTVLQEDTLSKCCEFMDQHPDCGGLGVRMIDGKGKFLPESKRGLPTPAVALYKMTGLSNLFPKSKVFGRYHLKYLPENETNPVDVLSGAFMLMRNSVLQEVGLLDEAFFMYGEDIDLSYRITKGGYKNYYFPGTTIIHYKGESTKKKSANYVKVFYNAMVLFAQKHYSSKMAGWFAFFISIAIKLRAFAALVWRFLGDVILPAADFALVYLGFFVIARYWEVYNKFVRDFYPTEYYVLHIPIYILLIVVAVFLSGGYDKPSVFRRIARGTIAGSVIVFAIYGFLPKEMQFSRAILFLGCAWSILALPLVRYGIRFLKTGKLLSSDISTQRIAIVSSKKEAERIQGLLVQSGVQYAFLGFISPDGNKPAGYLGSMDQLAEVAEIFNVNTVIFSASDVASGQIMKSMGELSDLKVNFKIVPENSLVIIGSSNKNTPGELYTIDINFAINEQHLKRKKRIYDSGVVFLLWLFFPFFMLSAAGRKMLSQSLAVLIGKKTWMSYTGRADIDNLPVLKPGVFYPAEAYKGTVLESHISLAYARDYSVHKDIQLMWRIIFS